MSDSARQWLKTNKYADVDSTLERIEKLFEKRGKGTRRSWWKALAGTHAGKRSKVEGISLPIINAARIRMGWEPVPSGLCRTPGEAAPPKVPQARWTKAVAGREKASR